MGSEIAPLHVQVLEEFAAAALLAPSRLDPEHIPEDPRVKLRRRYAESGLCVLCGRLADPKSPHCFRCKKSRAEHARKARKERRERGVCARCPEPARPGKRTCAACGKVESKSAYERLKKKRARDRKKDLAPF